jgi:sugar lactone lactonase YvrE
VLAKGFYYANGVALAEDESYLVMAETNRIRVHKFWLKGDKVRGLPSDIDLHLSHHS